MFWIISLCDKVLLIPPLIVSIYCTFLPMLHREIVYYSTSLIIFLLFYRTTYFLQLFKNLSHGCGQCIYTEQTLEMFHTFTVRF